MAPPITSISGTFVDLSSNGRTALYRLFSAGGALLYVGISDNPRVRWEQHRRDKAWWPEVSHYEIQWHGTRDSAETAEVAAITAESPRYNILGTAKHGEASRSRRTAGLPQSPLAIDWTEYDSLPPRERYNAIGGLIDEAKALVAARRAQIAHDLAAQTSVPDAAKALDISVTRVYGLAARHRETQTAQTV